MSRRSLVGQLHADPAPGDVVLVLHGVDQRAGVPAGVGGSPLLVCQPETVDVGEEVAGPSRPLALQKGQRFEFCQTAS